MGNVMGSLRRHMPRRIHGSEGPQALELVALVPTSEGFLNLKRGFVHRAARVKLRRPEQQQGPENNETRTKAPIVTNAQGLGTI